MGELSTQKRNQAYWTVTKKGGLSLVEAQWRWGTIVYLIKGGGRYFFIVKEKSFFP